MKIRRKAVVFFILLALTLSCCSCTSGGENKNSEMEAFLDEVISTPISELIDKKAMWNAKLAEYDGEHENFEDAIINKISQLQAEDDFENCCKLVVSLDVMSFKDEDVRDTFQTFLNAEKEEVFSDDNTALFENYLRLIQVFADYNYYGTIVDSFPYAEVKDYVETHCNRVIYKDGDGGYYDDHQYEDNSYWYDPLSRETVRTGRVGTYRSSEQYVYAGDFLIEVASKYWYGTTEKDKNNSQAAHLYFLGKRIFPLGYDEIVKFMECAEEENNHIYYCSRPVDDTTSSVSTDTYYTIIMIGPEAFTIIQQKGVLVDWGIVEKTVKVETVNGAYEYNLFTIMYT